MNDNPAELQNSTYMITTHKELFRAFPETPDNYKTTIPPYWSPYKTASEKLGYEKRLPLEIQPFIRDYFQKHKGEMVNLRESQSLPEYISNTKKAWEKHLQANTAIDCFLNYELKSVFGDWSPQEWVMARRLLIAGMDTDHVKAMYSGGIKEKLEIERTKLVAKYGRNNPEEFNIQLLTPSFITFYEARLLEHKKYKLSVLEGKPDDELKRKMVEKYYGGDENMFTARESEVKLSNDTKLLQNDIEETEKNIFERSAKKRYLMMERHDIQDFEELLHFDNVTEYEYTFSLKGLPDLFLREEVLKRLKEADVFAVNTSVFSLNADDFTNAIDRLLEKQKKHFYIRLRPYRQTMDTCGTACIMSILNRKGLPLTQENEMGIWERVGKPYNFPGGLAHVLLRYGFHVTYVQDKPNLLQTENPEFASSDKRLLAAAKEYVQLHEQAVKDGLHFKVDTWDFQKVKDEVNRGNVCLLYIHVTATMSHCILARGIRENRLEILDPLGGVKYLSEPDLNEIIDTPMGKRMLIVNKLPRDFFDVINERLGVLEY